MLHMHTQHLAKIIESPCFSILKNLFPPNTENQINKDRYDSEVILISWNIPQTNLIKLF